MSRCRTTLGDWEDWADERARATEEAGGSDECARGYRTLAEALRGRRRTCHNVAEPPRDGFWPTPHFRCSLCGREHVSLTYVRFCPSCGAEVVLDDE